MQPLAFPPPAPQLIPSAFNALKPGLQLASLNVTVLVEQGHGKLGAAPGFAAGMAENAHSSSQRCSACPVGLSAAFEGQGKMGLST